MGLDMQATGSICSQIDAIATSTHGASIINAGCILIGSQTAVQTACNFIHHTCYQVSTYASLQAIHGLISRFPQFATDTSDLCEACQPWRLQSELANDQTFTQGKVLEATASRTFSVCEQPCCHPGRPAYAGPSLLEL